MSNMLSLARDEIHNGRIARLRVVAGLDRPTLLHNVYVCSKGYVHTATCMHM